MAKKSGGPNKSAAIREYVAANPEAKPKEIVDAMKSQGMDVSPAFVSTIKSKSATGGNKKKKARGGGRPKAPRAAASASTARAGGGGELSVNQLVKAKKLADELGGVANARAVLEALEKIVR